MKGLLKVLSPFAPDQSGAASVFYDMDCITVICDAGGCTGNICGFDEPRWFGDARPIFSAGLRDMDAILGRDDRLIDKLKLVSDKLEADFAAIIGTPVPAVIGTDMKALKRMAEKRCGLPVVTVDCTGTKLYDEGEDEAFMQLMEGFAGSQADAGKGEPAAERRLGVLGATPLNLSNIKADELIREKYEAEGYDRVMCYGMGDGLDSVRLASTVEKNIVIAPSGIRAAEYLKEKFGVPYELDYPVIAKTVAEKHGEIKDAKVLIIHQQVAANALRAKLEAQGNCVAVASFFGMKKELMNENDVQLETEEAYCRLVEEGGFDYVICDPLLRRAVKKDSYGEWIDWTHFAVSGNLEEEICAL